ncbi:transposase [Escherichia coli O26:H11 str. 2010C-3902]|nr:transposase [Escherichia coli O26:H11 str. 2010C-3902]
MYFPSATGTAVTRLVHEKFLPSRLFPSVVHICSLHRRYKIYSVNWD